MLNNELDPILGINYGELSCIFALITGDNVKFNLRADHGLHELARDCSIFYVIDYFDLFDCLVVGCGSLMAGWLVGWIVEGGRVVCDWVCCELLSKGTALCHSLPNVSLSVLRLGSC